MPEQSTPVQTVKVEYRCDKCGEANMKPSGTALLSSPPWYPHECPACGWCKPFRHRYPQIRHEVI